MSYPYSEEAIAKALKVEFGSDSPVIPESFKLTSSEGEFGGKIEGTYEFKTEDGQKYQITTEGNQIVIPYRFPINRMSRINSIRKI